MEYINIIYINLNFKQAIKKT